MAHVSEQEPETHSTLGNDSSNDDSFEFQPNRVPALLEIKLLPYQDELDDYRLPLEDLKLSEQQLLVSDWIHSILSTPKLRIEKKFLSKLEKVMDDLHVDWNSEIQVSNLVHMIYPKESESIDYVKESYVLLIYMLMLRTKYQKIPLVRYKIKRSAFYGLKSYLKFLDEKIRRKNVQKRTFWTEVKFGFQVLVCVLIMEQCVDYLTNVFS